MSFAKKHNRLGFKFSFEIPENHEFVSFKDLSKGKKALERIHTVRGIYINKHGHYGDAPVLITDDFLVNAPSHMMDDVKEILTDNDSCCMIDKGLVGFKIYSYESKYGTNYGCEWVDIELDDEKK